MKRTVYIITGFYKSEIEKNDFNLYLNYYFTFFKSIAGGAYENDEIICLQDTTIEKLKEIISIEKSEFGIIVFIGHGATKFDNQLFQINQNTVIKAGQIDLNIEKQIIIVESCRTLISNIPIVDLNDTIPKFRDGGTIRTKTDRLKSKELYINQIQKCSPGVSICFACSNGQEANNFYFSKSILQKSFQWHLNKDSHFDVLKINEAMFLTILDVIETSKREISKEQIPEMLGIFEFPFAISKY